MVAGQRFKYSSIFYRLWHIIYNANSGEFQILSVWIPDFLYFIHPRGLNLAPEKATAPQKEN